MGHHGRMTAFGWVSRRWVSATVFAAVVVGSVVAAAILRDNGDHAPDGSGTLPPFYLEATVESDDGSLSIGTTPAGSPPVLQHRSARVRWLQYSPDESRIEIETIEPSSMAGTDMIVYADGQMLYYRHETNSYRSNAVPPAPGGTTVRVRPWSFSVMVGPWFGAATTIDEFVEELRTISNNSTGARMAGEGTVLGRPVTIIEQSPVSTSVSDGVETRGGVARYWVDTNRMVVVRQEIDDSPAIHVVAEVTRLEWNPKGRGSVAFTPPPGATQEQ